MIWIGICFLLCITIVMIGYEFVDTPNALKGNYVKSLCENYSNVDAPAKRLVIFVVDGMTYLSAGKEWLSKIIDNNNYGHGEALVAKPLTRAGLVAIFSGHYEHIINHVPLVDIKKVNDSVFNHVYRTHYFGPEIVKEYFRDGDTWNGFGHTKNVNLEENVDLGDDHTMGNIKKMFNKPNRSLIESTKIFYIHLTSINIIGMVNRKGNEVMQKVIDNVAYMIKEIVELFDRYLNDNRTVFLILSDHGMTKWGTNGDSLYEEILVPVIIWGKQIAIGHHRAMRQIDLCPLIASLLGIEVPANSLGSLQPDYLNTTQRSLAHSAMCTALQQAELCQNTWTHIDKGLLIKRILGRTMSYCNYKNYLQALRKLMDNRNYTYVIKTSAKLTRLSKSCIENVENFYKSCLLYVLIMSYFGWIFGTVCMLSTDPPDQRFNSCGGRMIKLITCAAYLSMFVFSTVTIILERLPSYYIILIIIPSMAWMLITLKTGPCVTKLMKMKPSVVVLYAAVILAMVEYTYWAKFYPYIFSFYLITYACFLITINRNIVPYHVIAIYFISCIVLVTTPAFPVVGLSEMPNFLKVSAALWIAASCFFTFTLGIKGKQCFLSLAITASICISTWITAITFIDTNLHLKIVSWFILLLPFVSMIASANLAERLLQMVASTGAPYLLLSTRHEPIVLMVFAFNLYALLRFEISGHYYKFQDFLRGINLYYYTTLAIFATGNLPYISSYDILITRFFTSTPGDIQIALLTLYKITVPLTVIACFFYALCLYIGHGLRTTLMVTTVTAAVSSARHCLGIILSVDPMHKLPEFLLGNVLYLLLFLPFSLAPLLIINIKKIKP